VGKKPCCRGLDPSHPLDHHGECLRWVLSRSWRRWHPCQTFFSCPRTNGLLWRSPSGTASMTRPEMGRCRSILPSALNWIGAGRPISPTLAQQCPGMKCAANSASDDAPLGWLPARGGGGFFWKPSAGTARVSRRWPRTMPKPLLLRFNAFSSLLNPFPLIHGQIRRVVLSRFPYAVYFR